MAVDKSQDPGSKCESNLLLLSPDGNAATDLILKCQQAHY